MTIKIKKTVTIKDKSGAEIILTDTDKTEVTTDAIFVCDNPRCGVHGEGFAESFYWNEEAAQKDFRSLPDGFFTLVKIIA